MDGRESARRDPWRVATRWILSLGAAAVSLVWCFLGFILWVLRCDEACGADDDPYSWQWTGQFLLTAVGVVAAFVAIALGFSDRGRNYAVAGATSIMCGVVWLAWVQVLG